MISSRSLGTATARLAKVARFTPRLPRTLLNLLLVGRVIGDRGGGVLELVAR